MNHLRIARLITTVLENRFKIGKFRFGIDPLLGLIPGFGDIAGFLISAYLLWIAYTLKLPQDKMNIMVRNVIVDLFLGLVPFVGDVSDFVYRANSKNMKIIEEHYKQMTQN
ncbi:MAG TPA: DUF4112 domain-containing protein [Candidatus Nitrosocosmicus sp.]|nr:DUF4112 domain-containing protein [Candidatus Nitrosocosmicus sp.]